MPMPDDEDADYVVGILVDALHGDWRLGFLETAKFSRAAKGLFATPDGRRLVVRRLFARLAASPEHAKNVRSDSD